MNSTQELAEVSQPAAWKPVLLGAMAGGLGWGIRGQYGHETGAMIAGLLVSLTLTLLFCKRANALAVARAVAWCTVGIGFGGSMTYGQTIGLTQNAPVVGNWEALRWGMLGLAIKGGLWIGFGSAFLGMGLGGKRYSPIEMLLVMIGLLLLSLVGIWLFNQPFDSANKVLPRLYFSVHPEWEPDPNIKPRREVWGGMLLALTGLLLYVRLVRKDFLAGYLGLWGLLGGALGFPLGQCLQAGHAWNLAAFQTGWLAQIDPLINWWNWMETTFGLTMGATIGLGVWIHRQRIALPKMEPVSTIPLPVEIYLLGMHLFLLIDSEFTSYSRFSSLYDNGILLGLIPVVMIASGRLSPYWMALPITLLPIAVKTLRQLAYKEHLISPSLGWLVYFALPLLFAVVLAIVFSLKKSRQETATPYLRTSLLYATSIYFFLNFAFFHYPWPWQTWTMRVPNAILFLICAVSIAWLALSTRIQNTKISSPD